MNTTFSNGKIVALYEKAIQLGIPVEIIKEDNTTENEMTFKNYQELAGRTINTDLTENMKLAHALYGLSSETGEISGIFQKELQGHEVKRDDLEEEIGDLLWFIAELCTVFGFNMGEIAQGNIDKLKKRYPDGFDEDRSVNRELYSKKKFFGGFDFAKEDENL